MLTRIEIDGFKTFDNFVLDLQPFTVILGPNAAGKSNLFDAIRLLSRLGTVNDVREATRHLRGDTRELFRLGPEGEPVHLLRLAAEVLLEPVVRDPWGRARDLQHTRLRYEITLERRSDPRGLGRLVVREEKVLPILAKTDPWRRAKTSPVPSSTAFRRQFLKYKRQQPWLSTQDDGEQPMFLLHQDGNAGRRREVPPGAASLLSSITAPDFLHLFALREELRSWRFLQLNPTAMRSPSRPPFEDEILAPDGSNLAAVLARIKAETVSDTRPRGYLPDIVLDLARVIPGIREVDVRGDRKAGLDPENREYRVDVAMRDGLLLPSSVISDGTLRVLALFTLLHDPKHRSLVCFEEPENGIHPARLRALIEGLQDLVTDPSETEAPELPFSQLLINSHSPVVLAALMDQRHARDGALPVVFCDLATVVDPQSGSALPRTRMRPVLPKNQGDLLTRSDRCWVTRFEVDQYLATVNHGS